MSLSERIKTKAVELGFDLVGIAPAERALHANAFHDWLAAGYHGEMAWFERDPERRCDPGQVLPGARSVVVVGRSYFVQDPPDDLWNDPLRGRIARYAWGRDYHKVLTPLIRQLSDFIASEGPPDTRARGYVDTGPVLEHDFAAQAGLGFMGKHSLIINPDRGSYVFLAEVITSVELEYDQPAGEQGAVLPKAGTRKVGSCGACRRCLDICPTHAFPAPYIVNGSRCISYLTIELRNEIPLELRPLMKNWIYGCDECQSICPWVHRYSKPSEDHWLGFDPDWCVPSLTELMALDDEGFLQRFKGTPVMRTKRRGLLRNAAVALGNSGCREAVPVLEQALNDPEPLIVDHAQWALDQLI